MAWTSTKVTQYVVADRQVHVYDCVYGGTGYGGGQSLTGATGATGPTLTDLGFAEVTDSEMEAVVVEKDTYYDRKAVYNIAAAKLIIGATAAQDISDCTFRLRVTGRYGA